jgi:hypothetical protein
MRKYGSTEPSDSDPAEFVLLAVSPWCGPTDILESKLSETSQERVALAGG